MLAAFLQERTLDLNSLKPNLALRTSKYNSIPS
jgi:hypothetical protein